MKVYIIIMQSTIGNEKTRLCSTQCYGGTFVSEESANTFLNEHKEDIFKNMIASVKDMEVDLLNGINAYHRDVLYTITCATNFNHVDHTDNGMNELYTTFAIPNLREAHHYLNDVCDRPDYHFSVTGVKLHLVSKGEASAYFKEDHGEKRAYIRIDRLVFNHSDKIGFVMD